MKRVKLLWLLPFLAAVTGGVVFLRCAGGDTVVEKPLEWANVWELQVSYTPDKPTSDMVFTEIQKLYDEIRGMMDEAARQAVESVPAFEQLKPAEKETLVKTITGADEVIGKMLDADFRDALLDFLNNNPAANDIIWEYGLEDEVEQIVDAIDQEVKVIQKEVEVVFEDIYLDLGTQEIPALEEGIRDMLNDMKTPKISYDLNLFNGTPITFKIYGLIFGNEAGNTRIQRIPVSDKGFCDFVDALPDSDTDYVNLLYDTKAGRGGMEIKPRTSSPASGSVPMGLITGPNPLALRLAVVINNDKPEAVLRNLEELLEKRELVDVKLKVTVEVTNNLEALFGL